MGTKIVYVGPLRSPDEPRGDVEIADTGQWARYGEPIEVETDLAEVLLEQETNWARTTSNAAKVAGGKRRTPKVAKAAPSPEPEPDEPAASEQSEEK